MRVMQFDKKARLIMEWFKYSERKPEKGGVYLWKMTSKVNGLKVIIRSEMRMRAAGLSNVLSPEFDYWNGYSLTVPNDLEWANDEKECPKVWFEGLPSLATCNFCKNKPTLRAVQRSDSGGSIVAPKPYLLNRFSLSCCDWVSVSSNDVVDMVTKWNETMRVMQFD